MNDAEANTSFPALMRDALQRGLAAGALLGLAACSTKAPPPAEPPHDIHPYYAAVWSASAPESRIDRAGSAADLSAPEPFQLVDLEVTTVDSARFYAGLFRAEPPDQGMVLDELSAEDFELARESQNSQGRCLTGFEAWREPDHTIRYAGVWHDGCSGDLLVLGLSPIAFSEKERELRGSHHLVDLETVADGAQLRVSGLWYPGAEPEPTWGLYGVSWETFHEQAHDLRQAGYNLVDLDVQEKPHHWLPASQEDGVRPEGVVISGLWRAGDAADWLGVDEHWEQLSCAARQLGKGSPSSGILADGTTICDQGPVSDKAPPTQQPLRLLVFESYPRTIPSCAIRQHGSPLHDSGTAGPDGGV